MESKPTGIPPDSNGEEFGNVTIILWVILFVIAWPIALLALVLYPLVWLLALPFRLVGISVKGVLETVRAVVLLPARLLGGRPRR